MSSADPSIELFAELVPKALLPESGKVFYSGRAAFSCPRSIYILGANPGGDPRDHQDETVGNHTRKVLEELPDDWSAYRDETWEGAAPGTYGMAPRVLHLFGKLGLAPELVPASNLVFVRSRREEQIKDRQAALADQCWPFHARVIAAIRPRVVLCMGATAGEYVRRRLLANTRLGQFVEQNNRRWTSSLFAGADGIRVVVATHPSVADWSALATDPSALVQEALR